VEQRGVVVVELDEGHGDVEYGAESKNYGYRIGARSHLVVAKAGLDGPRSGMPAVAFCQEDTGQSRNQPVAAGVVDEVALEVVDARFARSPRVAFFLAFFAIRTGSDESHQCCMSALLSSQCSNTASLAPTATFRSRRH
jgi:hypothetical protein